MVDLSTTNLLLGIMAAVSVLQALVLIGAGVMGYRAYSRAMQTVNELEARHVTPLMERVNFILDDVKGVTARVSQQTERVDHAVRGTIDRVDQTADRVRMTLREKLDRLVAAVRVVRDTVEHMLAGSRHRTSAPTA